MIKLQWKSDQHQSYKSFWNKQSCFLTFFPHFVYTEKPSIVIFVENFPTLYYTTLDEKFSASHRDCVTVSKFVCLYSTTKLH